MFALFRDLLGAEFWLSMAHPSMNEAVMGLLGP
jgi:hypothetical protein